MGFAVPGGDVLGSTTVVVSGRVVDDGVGVEIGIAGVLDCTPGVLDCTAGVLVSVQQ